MYAYRSANIADSSHPFAKPFGSSSGSSSSSGKGISAQFHLPFFPLFHRLRGGRRPQMHLDERRRLFTPFPLGLFSCKCCCCCCCLSPGLRLTQPWLRSIMTLQKEAFFCFYTICNKGGNELWQIYWFGDSEKRKKGNVERLFNYTTWSYASIE